MLHPLLLDVCQIAEAQVGRTALWRVGGMGGVRVAALKQIKVAFVAFCDRAFKSSEGLRNEYL